MSIMFNQICINAELVPEYTYFKPHDPAAHSYNSTLDHSYKVVMYLQKLHHFCNTSSPDDGQHLGRKYRENNKSWNFHQPIPTEYHKIYMAIRKY